MKTVCDTFDLELQEVFISKLLDGVFYSNLVFTNGTLTYEIDSRTSDALALAARYECPIFVDERILDEAGIESDPNAEGVTGQGDEELTQKIEELTTASARPGGHADYTKMTVDELKDALSKALDSEDYEMAARLRDELNKRG